MYCHPFFDQLISHLIFSLESVDTSKFIRLCFIKIFFILHCLEVVQNAAYALAELCHSRLICKVVINTQWATTMVCFVYYQMVAMYDIIATSLICQLSHKVLSVLSISPASGFGVLFIMLIKIWFVCVYVQARMLCQIRTYTHMTPDGECIHIQTHTYVHIHTYTYIHIHTYTYIHTHIYIHIYTYIHTHTYIHIHTYTCIHI